MLNNDIDIKLNEILNQIHQGRVALFLGAGASHAAGGPTGKKLTEMIKEKFLNVDQSLTDFIEVCQDVIDSPPYNLNDLEDFIKSKLESLQPTRHHRFLTKFNWAAIFTTNFDDLIEVAYRINTEERLKPCKPISSENFSINPSDNSKICLFKIMGSITATEDDSAKMVLSRADYNRALIRRKKYLELLSDFVKTGITIFIGYSFKDRIVLDIIDDLVKLYGKDRLPWNYALFDKIHPMDEKTQYMFSSRKIIPLEYNFENFFNFLNNSKNIPPKKYNINAIRLKLKGHILEINEADARQYAEYFDILNEEKINQNSGEKDGFFTGANNSWGAFKEEWDFKRDLYISPSFKRILQKQEFIGCFKDRVFDELKKYNIGENKVLLLKGMAGVGKTMMLRRLAYDVYKSGDAPVIIINSSKINFDYKLLTSFIESLNHELNLKIPEGQHIPPIKPIIIFDDAASLIRHVNRLKDYLTSRGRPALIIATERSGEWDLMWKTFPFSIPKENIYEISELLTDDEKKKIIDHFYNLDYIQTKGEFWDTIMEREFESSFFATIFTIVHPSKKPLSVIIQNQYQNLTDLTKKAFQYICCFHQFNLAINIELLVRSLRITYDNFYNDVIGNDASKVIFDEEDETGNLLYRTHHRIIAKKTVDSFFGDPEMQKNIFLDIFNDALLSNRKEMQICEKLLIEHIGPNAKPQILSHEQQRQIFKIICEKNPVRSLVHHWGVLEIDDHNHLEAERLLKWALEIPRDGVESYRGESDQNILTSLGGLYSHMGLSYLKKSKFKDAEECFEKAEASFQSAKHGEFPNAYAYHSHSFMLYSRGNQTSDETQKMNYYGNALEILAIAKDNLNDEDLQQIVELETSIWSQIGNEERITHSLETLRDKYNSGRGYYLNAELLFNKADDLQGEERIKTLELALRKVQKGLKNFPNDEYCLRLRSKLLKDLSPNDLDSYYNSLVKWKASATLPNAWLLYELGRTSFILGYYDTSKEHFRELETSVGMGHKLRSRARNPILDQRGKIKEFEGTIINVISSYDGSIKCETLRSLKYSISFRPIACKFTASTGNSVKFHIEFSYRGPWAENVKKT